MAAQENKIKHYVSEGDKLLFDANSVIKEKRKIKESKIKTTKKEIKV